MALPNKLTEIKKQQLKKDPSCYDKTNIESKPLEPKAPANKQEEQSGFFITLWQLMFRTK